jgi:hypothetical protein
MQRIVGFAEEGHNGPQGNRLFILLWFTQRRSYQFILYSVRGLTTPCWDHFEPKSSNKYGSHLQRLVKKMRMRILLHL